MAAVQSQNRPVLARHRWMAGALATPNVRHEMRRYFTAGEAGAVGWGGEGDEVEEDDVDDAAGAESLRASLGRGARKEEWEGEWEEVVGGASEDAAALAEGAGGLRTLSDGTLGTVHSLFGGSPRADAGAQQPWHDDSDGKGGGHR